MARRHNEAHAAVAPSAMPVDNDHVDFGSGLTERPCFPAKGPIDAGAVRGQERNVSKLQCQ